MVISSASSLEVASPSVHWSPLPRTKLGLLSPRGSMYGVGLLGGWRRGVRRIARCVFCVESGGQHRVFYRRSYCNYIGSPFLGVRRSFPSKIEGEVASSFLSLPEYSGSVGIIIGGGGDRTCLAVFFALPRGHWSLSVAPIRCKYPFSLAIPVRSCPRL